MVNGEIRLITIHYSPFSIHHSRLHFFPRTSSLKPLPPNLFPQTSSLEPLPSNLRKPHLAYFLPQSSLGEKAVSDRLFRDLDGQLPFASHAVLIQLDGQLAPHLAVGVEGMRLFLVDALHEHALIHVFLNLAVGLFALEDLDDLPGLARLAAADDHVFFDVTRPVH